MCGKPGRHAVVGQFDQRLPQAPGQRPLAVVIALDGDRAALAFELRQPCADRAQVVAFAHRAVEADEQPEGRDDAGRRDTPHVAQRPCRAARREHRGGQQRQRTAALQPRSVDAAVQPRTQQRRGDQRAGTGDGQHQRRRRQPQRPTLLAANARAASSANSVNSGSR